ncbi:MAG: SoxY-related AACIE arm protein [Hyphomicrobiaceae bacterium]
MAKPDRRRVLAGAAVLAALPLVPNAASATPEALTAAMNGALGGRQPKPGKVKLDIPAIAENGNSIQLTVTVESPMTAAEHVKAIYVFAEKNPLPDVARFHLGPRAGRAKVSTSIRLATSQKVIAAAALNDGSLWSDEKEVIVTLAACLEAG